MRLRFRRPPTIYNRTPLLSQFSVSCEHSLRRDPEGLNGSATLPCWDAWPYGCPSALRQACGRRTRNEKKGGVLSPLPHSNPGHASGFLIPSLLAQPAGEGSK